MISVEVTKTETNNTVIDEIKRKDEIHVLLYATWCSFSEILASNRQIIKL